MPATFFALDGGRGQDRAKRPTLAWQGGTGSPTFRMYQIDRPAFGRIRFFSSTLYFPAAAAYFMV
jgi:hypothetical protein